MRTSISVLTGLVLVAWAAGASAEARVKVAVVTGGHPFTEKPFLAMFEGQEGIEFTHVALKDDSEIFEDISAWPYDVVVLYNMTQKISDKRKENLLALLNRGVGLVVLHHAIADYPDWPEFWKIIGARYFLEDVTENGVKYPRCEYEHGVDYKVHIEDAASPITKGIPDFMINDETYKGYKLEPDNHILLTTDNPKCQREIGWSRTYGKAKVCYFQMGHGESIFADANYRRLIAQGIRWAASK